MPVIDVDLSISPDEYLKQYQGYNRVVTARCRSGRSVRFPANILQPYVTHNGIRGSFRIHFNDDNKFQFIEKLG